jgi:ferritin-like metal-binding protein YciE
MSRSAISIALTAAPQGFESAANADSFHHSFDIDGFKTHRQETQVQIERLKQVFEMLGEHGVTCEAINGILEEGEGTMEDFQGSEALDAGLVTPT